MFHVQAADKYEASLRLKPSAHAAMYNWGVALSDIARLQKDTDPEAALRCLQQAAMRYAEALDLQPGNPQALNNWGLVLQARLAGAWLCAVEGRRRGGGRCASRGLGARWDGRCIGCGGTELGTGRGGGRGRDAEGARPDSLNGTYTMLGRQFVHTASAAPPHPFCPAPGLGAALLLPRSCRGMGSPRPSVTRWCSTRSKSSATRSGCDQTLTGAATTWARCCTRMRVRYRRSWPTSSKVCSRG